MERGKRLREASERDAWRVISDNFEAFVCNLDTQILPSFSNLSTFPRVLGLFLPVWPYVAREPVHVGARAQARATSPHVRNRAVKPRDEELSSLCFLLLVCVAQRWACFQTVSTWCWNLSYSIKNFCVVILSGYTHWAFIKLKSLGNIGCQNGKYMWFYTWFKFIFWQNISWRKLKIAFPRL